MASNYTSIENKLREFRAKFYKNLLYRGLVLCLGISGSYLLLLSVIEYFGEFSKVTRSFLFFSFVIIALSSFVFLIAIPLLKLLNVSKGINDDDAAKIIGDKISSVNDKLLNVIQLYRIAIETKNDLALAGVNQKAKELEKEDFSQAINIKRTVKFLQLLLFPVLIAGLIGLLQPDILKNSTKRILAYEQVDDFVSKYAVVVLNPSFEAKQNDDYLFQFKLESNVQVSSVLLEQNGIGIELIANDLGFYQHTFKNLQNSFDFKLILPDLTEKNYHVKVQKRAVLQNILFSITPPKYTGLEKQQLKNENALDIPAGSSVDILTETKNTASIRIIKPFIKAFNTAEDNLFKTKFKALKSGKYNIQYKAKSGLIDSIQYNISIIADAYPSISVQSQIDTLNPNLVYLAIQIGDDYGFSKLLITNSEGEIIKAPKIELSKNLSTQELFYALNLNDIELRKDEKLSLRVYDNDGVNGPKFTTSQALNLKKFSAEELKKESNQNAENLKQKIKESAKELKEVTKDIESLRKKMLQQNKATWGDKQQLSKLLKKQENILNEVENLKKNQQNLSKQQELNNTTPEELLEKQNRLNELFNELLDEESKKLQEELQKALDSLQQDDLLKAMEKIELNNEELNKELDRNLELFKQFELERKTENLTQDLEKLAKDQKELSEKNKEQNTSEKQEELNKKFEELKKELDEIKKENKELENPLELPDTKKEEEQISEDQKEAKENLEQKKQKKAEEKQKEAADKMDEMQQQMKSSMQSSSNEKDGEDAEALRQLLDNLLSLSISEENIMQEALATKTNDPYYLKITQQQKKNIDDSKIIQDSLYALSKRVPELSNIVNREISSVNENLSEALKQLTERQSSLAASSQQYGITALNNLALLLDQALNQLQMKMNSNSSGKGSCSKPGSSGKPKPGSIKDMQESLKKQLQEMQKGQKPGEKPGDKNKGNSGSGMSMQMAKAAAKQAVIRQKLQELAKQYEKDGKKGLADGLKKIEEEMDKSEEDLYNKKLNAETIKRQQEIISRLLEAEEADRKQGEDDKRESNAAQDIPAKKAEQLFKKQKENNNSQDLIKTLPAELKPYYKQKVTKYIQE